MKTLAEMREQVAVLRTEELAISEAGGKDGVDLTPENVIRLGEIDGEMVALGGEIEAAEQKADLLAGVTNRKLPAAAATPVVTDIHDNAQDDPTHGFAHMGEFMIAANTMYQQHGVDQRLVLEDATGMQQSVGSEGGLLVPPEFSQAIWDGMNTGADSLLSQTDNFTVEGDSLTMNANAETSRANGSRYGGVRGYWIAEAQQMTASKPKVRAMKLEPKEMAVLVYSTDKLLRNATATGQFITRAASDEINFMTGDAIVNGDGAGKPLGILASPSLISQAKETGQAAKTILFENVSKMWTRMHARARANAIWLINQEIEQQLMTMYIPIGTSGIAVYMPAGGISGAQFATLFGKPIVPIEYCRALGTKGDIILTDLSAYATGTKGGPRSDMSIHLRFDFNETAFRFLFEVDGQPWLAAAQTPYKGSNTLSTSVALATRG